MCRKRIKNKKKGKKKLPKFISFNPQKRVYRYVTENVWMANDLFKACQREYRKLKSMSLIRKTSYNALTNLRVKLIKAFFYNATLGLEIANLYADFLNPLAAKKIRCCRGKRNE